MSDSNIATVSLTVNAVNDGPTNSVPGARTVNEDTALVFSSANGNAISVSDVDAASGAIQVTLNATNAVLTPASGSGATVTGSATSNVTLSGTLAQVNAALDGLSCLGVSNFNSTRGDSVVSITTNDQGNTGSGGALSDADTVAVTVNAVNDPPVAQAKSYNAQANMKINGLTGLLAGATDPDTGDGGYTASFTVGTVSATTPAGGTISNLNNAAGSFDFDPPPGASGDVTFTYTVCDTGNPAPPACSAPATVTVNVAGPVIWFVNPAAGVNGDGRLSSPFNVLSSVGPVDAVNHRVFLYSGTASTGLALNSGEWLIGQGVSGSSFDSVMGIAPPTGTIARPSIAGPRPTVQGTVTLESNAIVKGLNLSTGASTGLADPAAAISGVTVAEVSATSTTGTAVSLSNVGGSISLTSVTSNGGTNGIALNSTTGSFTVTGTGSAGSGGTIQNKATGISLTSAASVSLSYMQLNDFTDFAIRGTSVNGFTLANSVVSGVNGNDAATDEGSIRFTDLTGVAAVTSTNISGGFENNFKLNNSTGTLNRLTFTSVMIGANSTAEGNDGIGIEGSGNSVVNVTVQNSTFTSARGDLFQMNHIGTGTADLIFTGNTLSNNHPGIATGGGGVTLGNGSTSTFTMNLSTNTFRDAVGHAVLIVKDVGTGTQRLTFHDNTIGAQAVANSGSLEGSGLKIQQAGQGTQTVAVTNNKVYQYNNDAILLQTGAGIAYGGDFNATLTGNTISNAGSNPAIGLPVQGINLNGGVTPGDTFAICADIGGAGTLANNLAGAAGPFGGGDYRLRQRQSTTVRLPGYGGGATDTAAVVAFINGRNLVSGTGTATVSSPPGGGFVGGAACAQP